MSSAPLQRRRRLSSLGSPQTPWEIRSFKAAQRQAAAEDKAARDSRERAETESRLQASVERKRRQIAELKRQLDGELDHDIGAPESAEQPDQPHRRKSASQEVGEESDEDEAGDICDDNDEDYEDDNANLSSAGIELRFEEAQSSDTLFRRLTGLNKTEYEDLRDRVLPFIVQTSNTGEKLKKKAHVETWKVKPRLQLFVTLVWLRLYQPYWFMAYFFGLPVRYVPKILKRCVAALSRALNELDFAAGGMPNAQDIEKIVKEHQGMQIGDVVMNTAFDGMHLPVRGRQKLSTMEDDEQDEIDALLTKLKNAKHQVLATNMLVLVSVCGRLLQFWGPHGCGNESVQLRDACDVRGFLKKHGLSVVADAGLCINQDAHRDNTAFFTVGPKLVRLAKFVVKNKDKFAPHVAEYFQKIYDSTRIASRLRIIVENWIGAARQWRVLRDVWRGYAGDWQQAPLYGLSHRAVVRAVFLLLNTRLLYRPLRMVGWKPDVSELPPNAKYGYPGAHLNSKTLEDEAAQQFVAKPKRGRASLTKAFEAAQLIVTPKPAGKAKSGGSVQATQSAKADDKSSLTETSSDAEMPMASADNSEEQEAADVEGLRVTGLGKNLRALTKAAALKQKEAKQAEREASTAAPRKKRKNEAVGAARSSAAD